jgi:hypothetical protein
MVVMIVAIIAYSRVQRAKYGSGRDAVAARDDGETQALRGEVRQLKDRIAVLERIVTDGDRNRGLTLEREIEALRDEREGR